MTNKASVCPTCGSAKRSVRREIAPHILDDQPCYDSWHDEPVASPRDPQKLVDALRKCVDDMTGPTGGWLASPKKLWAEVEAALKDWEENNGKA